MNITRIFTLSAFTILSLHADMIERTVLSLGGGQVSIENKNYGSIGMGISLASPILANLYLGGEIDGAIFNGSDQSVDMNSGLDRLMNISPLIGYHIGESLYLYAKAGYTFGTIGGGEQSVSGIRWGGIAQYDLNEKLVLSASVMSGEISVDYLGGTKDNTLTSVMLNLGMRF